MNVHMTETEVKEKYWNLVTTAAVYDDKLWEYFDELETQPHRVSYCEHEQQGFETDQEAFTVALIAEYYGLSPDRMAEVLRLRAERSQEALDDQA